MSKVIYRDDKAKFLIAEEKDLKGYIRISIDNVMIFRNVDSINKIIFALERYIIENRS